MQGKNKKPYVEVAQDAEGLWHWQLYAGNGAPLCKNATAYKTKKHAVQSIRACPGVWEKVEAIIEVDTPDEDS